ncbi:MAG: EexN family lipoprotein [Pseudomonadota bacterium]
MKNLIKSAILAASAFFVAGCAEEQPPPSVQEFMNDAVLLDATMVRCSVNRAQTKYEPECMNAREAINRVARAEEAERRASLEAQSERKRQALRRTQEAAAEARRRAAEAARLREEAAYLAQFETGPEGQADGSVAAPINPAGSEPPAAAGGTVIPQAAPQPSAEPAPIPQSAPPEAGSGLDDVREELRRRQAEPPPQD